MKFINVFLITLLASQSVLIAKAQAINNFSFDNAVIVVPTSSSSKETRVIIIFLDDEVQIKSKKDGAILKTFKYADIKAAEYSFTEKPRWKEGLGLSAIGLLFPLVWVVTIPLGFTKTKNHWFTFRSEKDFAVLKLNKRIRKLFIPHFEVKTGVTVEAKGANK